MNTSLNAQTASDFRSERREKRKLRVQRWVCHREKRRWLRFTLYIRARVSRATLGASSRAIFVSAVFETRNENKRGKYVPVIYALVEHCSSQIYRLPSAHPSAQRRVTQRRTTPCYRYRNGLRFRVCGASMLITIVCSTIRLKCTFINRIHRGYLSGRQREGGRTISPWKRLDLREKRSDACYANSHSAIPIFLLKKKKKDNYQK